MRSQPQVKISRVDEKVLSSADRKKGVYVKVTQLRAQHLQHEASGARGQADSVVEMATQAITHTLPEDGKLPIQFQIQKEAEKIVIQVFATGLNCKPTYSNFGCYYMFSPSPV